MAETYDQDVVNANWDKVDGAFVLKDGVVKALKAVNAETLGGLIQGCDFQIWGPDNYALMTKEGDSSSYIVFNGANTNEPKCMYACCEALIVYRSDSGYKPVCASDFIKSSSSILKKNIVPYTDMALDKVLNLEICEYDMKDEDTHEIGLIANAESTPSEIVVDMRTDENGNIVHGISLSRYQTLIAKALQEHYAKRETELTDAQLMAAEAYEKQIEQETAMQLAVAEIYETMLGVA